MISPKKIKYNNYSSVDFPTFTLLTDVAFNSDNGEINTYLSRNAVVSESFSGKIKNVSSYKYTEDLILRITLIKDGFGDFSLDEARKVLSWLTSKDTPSFLDVYDDVHSEAILYSALGAFTSVQSYKLGNGRTVGFVAEFTSISPFAYSPIYPHQHTITEPTTFTVECNSDDPAYVYPRIIVEHNTNPVVRVNKAMLDESEHVLGTVYYYPEATNGKYYYWIDANRVLHNEATNTSNFTTTSVVIRNTETGTETVVRGSQQGETVVIDGANKVIYSDTYPNRVFGDKFGSNEHNLWQWLPLQNGINTITVIGNCKLTFNWREIRKIGEY